MTSPNLAAPHVAAAQNQKEVTINDATDALDLAMTASLSVVCTAGGTISVTTLQAQRNVRFALTGTPAAAFDLQLPAVPRLVALVNSTDQVATIKNATGATVALPAGKQALVYSSGTGVTQVGAAIADAYDFGMVAFETPASSAVMGKVVIPRSVTLPADFAGARGDVDTNPDASFEITVTRNGTTVGTITISTAGGFTFATSGGAAVALVAGDVVRFVAPGTADIAIEGIAVTLVGSLT
jgi:hypothetical protein